MQCYLTVNQNKWLIDKSVGFWLIANWKSKWKIGVHYKSTARECTSIELWVFTLIFDILPPSSNSRSVIYMKYLIFLVLALVAFPCGKDLRYALCLSTPLQMFLYYTWMLPKLTWDLLKICLRFDQDLPEICLKFAEDLPEIWRRFA